MSILRSIAAALITAAAAVIVVLGASSLSLAEGFSLAQAPTAPVETAQVVTAVPGETMVAATPAPSATPPPKLVTSTPLPTCAHPVGWNPYIVRSGDTVYWLASAYNTSVDEIMAANCLTSQTLIPGSELYLPALPLTATPSLTSTIAATACTPPWGWVPYTVRPGDSYYALAPIYGLTGYQLMTANCTASGYLMAGSTIYLPYYPPPPAPTWTSSPVPTSETVVPTEITVTVEPTTAEPPTAEPPASQTPEPDVSSPTASTPSEAPTISASQGQTSTPIPPADTAPAP